MTKLYSTKTSVFLLSSENIIGSSPYGKYPLTYVLYRRSKCTSLLAEFSGMNNSSDTFLWRGRDWKFAHTAKVSPSVTLASPSMDRLIEAPEKTKIERGHACLVKLVYLVF